MTTDDTVPTQPPHESLGRPDEPSVPSVPPFPPAAGVVPPVKHWYSYPSTHPPPTTPPEPAATLTSARERHPRRTARSRVQRRRVRREIGAPDDWAWVIIAAALLGLTAVMSMSVFFLLQATRETGTIATSAPAMEPTSILYGAGGILETNEEGSVGGMLGNGESMIIREGNIKEPFTVLLMGLDQRPGAFGMSLLTDTLILIRFDPVNNRIGILSLPRDLYVEVPPNYGLRRINTAYSLGELAGPGGGPQSAMQTIQYNFGIRVNEYVVVNFESFIKFIDLIGGVNVEVTMAIYDPTYPDMNYGYDPFYLEAGWHKLDGATALKYARARHGSDDIDRGRRQQQILYAVRDSVTTFDLIPQLAPRAFELWAEFDDGVDTGLSVEQMLQLVRWVKDVPPINYTNRVLGWEYVEAVNWQGSDILVPSRYMLTELMTEVFGPDYNQ